MGRLLLVGGHQFRDNRPAGDYFGSEALRYQQENFSLLVGNILC